MSSLLDDITQNLMAIEDEDTIIMGDIIMSDSSNKEDGDAGSEDQGCYLTNEPTGTWCRTPTYRSYRAPPTPPRPRTSPTRFRVVVKDFKEDEIYPSDIESDSRKVNTENAHLSNSSGDTTMSFINRLEKLNIDEEAVDKGTATDDIEVLRCNEVLPDDKDHLRGASANFGGSVSHKLHYRILKTTNRLVYKDIICKPYRHWTPLGMISFRRHDIAPVPAQKKVKTWWPA